MHKEYGNNGCSLFVVCEMECLKRHAQGIQKMCVFLTDQQSSVSYGELHRSWNWASAGFTNPQNVIPTRTMHTHHHTEPFTLYTRTKITTANTPAVSNTTTCTFIKYDLFVVRLQHTIHTDTCNNKLSRFCMVLQWQELWWILIIYSLPQKMILYMKCISTMKSLHQNWNIYFYIFMCTRTTDTACFLTLSWHSYLYGIM